jgi:hypothetical protein
LTLKEKISFHLKLHQKEKQQQHQQQYVEVFFPTPLQKNPNKLNHAEDDLKEKLELFSGYQSFYNFSAYLMKIMNEIKNHELLIRAFFTKNRFVTIKIRKNF